MELPYYNVGDTFGIYSEDKGMDEIEAAKGTKGYAYFMSGNYSEAAGEFEEMGLYNACFFIEKLRRTMKYNRNVVQ